MMPNNPYPPKIVSALLTVQDGAGGSQQIRLDSFGKNEVTFGRHPGCDIVIQSPAVSREHGHFRFHNGLWVIEDRGIYASERSTNGIRFRGGIVTNHVMMDGDEIIIDNGKNRVSLRFTLCSGAPGQQFRPAPVVHQPQPPRPAPAPQPPRPQAGWPSPGAVGGATQLMDVNAQPSSHNSSTVIVFDGSQQPQTLQLDSFGKGAITFGRQQGCDILLTSKLVSREHGRFVKQGSNWVIEDHGYYTQTKSTNGLICNDSPTQRRVLSEGDLVRIDNGAHTSADGVLFLFSAPGAGSWSTMPLGSRETTIGRDPGCTVVLSHISVSKLHAKIVPQGTGFLLIDNNSTNGIIVNGHRIAGRHMLVEKDVISITNSKLIFTRGCLCYCKQIRSGISVDASHVTIVRGKGSKSFVTGNDISMNIRPGELVAIIGGSGAGKSTILNAMCGYLPPARGNVYINGVDLYRNFDSLKKIVGYVPQSDIVYDNLTLGDMLEYTAKLRLPQDTSPAERESAIQRAIALVELQEKRNSYIRALSGGQRKRASIAVELLSDPNLLFLDEPASGLDPGTERSLMKSLREMANNGKTVILVTHSTLQLEMCDKIVFMGKGGNLCYFGSYRDALKFFGVSDVVDIYNMITDNAPNWRQRYDQTTAHGGQNRSGGGRIPGSKGKSGPQLPVLCARYAKLVFNDRQRLLLLLFQAPLLALLISLVANGKQFDQYEITKSLLFALSCSAFWVGMLNAIQEVCKERSILKREYMTGLSLTGYIASKIMVLGVLCLIQSVLIVSVFAVAVGLPEEGLILPAYLELLITTFLTAISSVAMGLFVSSLFDNADRAMTVAPILLMPQILFSGLIFKLDGITETISYMAVCRWSMEAFGTSADLNSLPLKLQEEGLPVPHDAEAFFEYTSEHLLGAWAILIVFCLALLVLARVSLQSIRKEKS